MSDIHWSTGTDIPTTTHAAVAVGSFAFCIVIAWWRRQSTARANSHAVPTSLLSRRGRLARTTPHVHASRTHPRSAAVPHESRTP